MRVLYVEDLELELGDHRNDCGGEHRCGVVVASRCHPGAPVVVKYFRHTRHVVAFCRQCMQPIRRFAVADRRGGVQ